MSSKESEGKIRLLQGFPQLTHQMQCDQGRPCQICKGTLFIKCLKRLNLLAIDREVPCVYNNKRSKLFSLQASEAENISPHDALASQNPTGFSGSSPPPLINNPDLLSHETLDYEHDRTASANEGRSENDMVTAISKQTSGIEYYGRSSNFVLLSRPLSQAQEKLPSGSPGLCSNMSPEFTTRQRVQYISI